MWLQRTETEKTNKKGENSKEDMYEKENGVSDNGSAGGSRSFLLLQWQEEKDPITIWCWDTSENGLKMNQAFTDATGIEVNMVAVESKDMTQKLQTTLASGGEMRHCMAGIHLPWKTLVVRYLGAH